MVKIDSKTLTCECIVIVIMLVYGPTSDKIIDIHRKVAHFKSNWPLCSLNDKLWTISIYSQLWID